MTPCRFLPLLLLFPFGCLGGIALPPWPLQGDPATPGAPPAPANFSAVQLADSAVLEWSSSAPFVLVMRAMSNAVLQTWDGYEPVAIVSAPSASFTDVENFSVQPPPPKLLSVALTGANEVVTLSRPVGLDYWLARSTNLITWEVLPVSIPGATDPFVYVSDGSARDRFYRAGASHGEATYHYVIMGISFSSPADQQTYAGKTTLLTNLGTDGLPPFTHSEWVFLTNFSAQ